MPTCHIEQQIAHHPYLQLPKLRNHGTPNQSRKVESKLKQSYAHPIRSGIIT